MLRKILGSLSLLLFLLSGCKEAPTVSILDEVSGVWKPEGEDGLMTLNNAGGKLQLVFDDVLVPVTLGTIDSEQETINLTATPKEGTPMVWTLRRIWDKEHKSFHLALTLHDGKQQEFSFVRKVSNEDLNRIANLQVRPQEAPPTTAHQAVLPSQETAPAIDEQKTETEETQSAGQMLSKYAVSFNCAKAGNAVEKMVCSNKTIGQLDGLLVSTYRERLDPQFGIDPDLMKAQQREWIKNRNACRDASCVEKAYLDRIKDLCELPVISGAHPGGDCDRI